MSLSDMLANAKEHHDVHARAEDSGCEGTYIEVARWNPAQERWERWMFEKVFGGEDMTLEQQDTAEAHDKTLLNSWPTAERIAAQINEASGNRDIVFIHHLPDWESPRQPADVAQFLKDFISTVDAMHPFDELVREMSRLGFNCTLLALKAQAERLLKPANHTGCYCTERDCLRPILPNDLSSFDQDGLCPRCRKENTK